MYYPINEIEQIVKTKLKGHENRWIHTQGVRKLAVYLGSLYGLDTQKIETAALLHDFCKYDSIDLQKRLIHDDLIIEKFKDAPEIYHAYAASNYCKNVLGIEDPVILDSIKYHVYGTPTMNLYIMILMVSDFAEENRSYEDCKIAHKILMEEQDILKASYQAINSTIEHLIKINVTPLEEEVLIRDLLERKIIEHAKVEKDFRLS